MQQTKVEGNIIHTEWGVDRAPGVVLYWGNPHSNLIVKDTNKEKSN